MAFDEQGQADTVERKVEICGRAYDLLVGDGWAAGGHRLRPERARGRDRDRGAQRLRQGVHRGAAADQGALPGLADERRHLEPLVLVPRQRRRARGDALGVPLRRDPGRARHGDRQRRPARRLRGHPARPARARRRRAARPPARRDRPARLVRRAREGRGDEARARPLLARGARRASGSSTRSCTGSSTSSRRTPRRRAQRRAAARRDRGTADGRDEGRGRPLRLGEDVPAAGGQERARDEARGRLPRAVHGGREGAHREQRPRPGEGRARHGEGRRARHRQEHRRRRARLQQLRGDRPRRDGAGRQDPRHGGRRGRATRSASPG